MEGKFLLLHLIERFETVTRSLYSFDGVFPHKWVNRAAMTTTHTKTKQQDNLFQEARKPWLVSWITRWRLRDLRMFITKAHPGSSSARNHGRRPDLPAVRRGHLHLQEDDPCLGFPSASPKPSPNSSNKRNGFLPQRGSFMHRSAWEVGSRGPGDFYHWPCRTTGALSPTDGIIL